MSTNNSDDLEVKEKDEEMVEDQTDETDAAEDGDTGSQDDATDAGEDYKARALKAEAILARQKKKKEKPASAEPQQTNQTQSTGLSEDETIFIAQGHDKEDLEKVRGLVKGFGIPFEEAQNHELYQAYAEKKAAETRKKKAQLGGSKGSGSADTGPKFKSGMTEAEHKEAWKKANGL